LLIINEWFHHTFNYFADFCLTGKIRNIKTHCTPTSKRVPLNFFVKNVNDGLTIFGGEDILEKSSRGDHLKSWTEILLSQFHVWDKCDVATQMKGRWKRGKTHSTVGNYHNHFPRTRLAVVFHVKCPVIIDDLLTAFVISPGITKNIRSSNLVMSTAAGYT
jgi:hypothetical protein